MRALWRGYVDALASIPIADHTNQPDQALFMGYCGISIVVGKYGGGYNIDDVSDPDQVQFKKFCYIATILYCPMALFVKVALLSILTRIFKPFRGKVWFIYCFLACLVTYYTIALIVKIRMCAPIPSVVSDITILILPLPLTWSLQMSRNRKLRVIGILSAGGLATAFSLYRLVLVLKDGNSANQTIVFMDVILSGNAEGGMGLICACLPVLNVLIAYYRKNYSSQKYYNQSSELQLADRTNNTNPKAGWQKAPNFGDQSHLISYAGGPEANESGVFEGIRKTVAVEQTVESASADSGSR
ncbi:hypothetical protein N7451_012676 [Penicillium sp. IBT 35674x]|nr:hypothetical protein N7451_012676 [Penicillium sp. IBT 35674x]